MNRCGSTIKLEKGDNGKVSLQLLVYDLGNEGHHHLSQRTLLSSQDTSA